MVVRSWRGRYLLDVWAEPRANSEHPRLVRAKVRDMSTDDTRYLGSLDDLAAVIDERLDADGITPRRWERE
jgi:hypothetical protein